MISNYLLQDRVTIKLKPELRSHRESEVFGWSRIPNNTGSQIFCPTPDVQLDHLLHHTLKLGIPIEMVRLLLKGTISFETFVETDFLLCTTISIDFNSQISFLLC